jgi:hypothetical protein
MPVPARTRRSISGIVGVDLPRVRTLDRIVAPELSAPCRTSHPPEARCGRGWLADFIEHLGGDQPCFAKDIDDLRRAVGVEKEMVNKQDEPR